MTRRTNGFQLSQHRFYRSVVAALDLGKEFLQFRCGHVRSPLFRARTLRDVVDRTVPFNCQEHSVWRPPNHSGSASPEPKPFGMASPEPGRKGRGGWTGDEENESSSDVRSGRLGRRSSRHNGNDEDQEGSHQHLWHGDQPCEPKKRHAGKKPNWSWSRNRKKPQGGLTRLPGRSRYSRLRRQSANRFLACFGGHQSNGPFCLPCRSLSDLISKNPLRRVSLRLAQPVACPPGGQLGTGAVVFSVSRSVPRPADSRLTVRNAPAVGSRRLAIGSPGLMPRFRQSSADGDDARRHRDRPPRLSRPAQGRRLGHGGRRQLQQDPEGLARTDAVEGDRPVHARIDHVVRLAEGQDVEVRNRRGEQQVRLCGSIIHRHRLEAAR